MLIRWLFLFFLSGIWWTKAVAQEPVYFYLGASVWDTPVEAAWQQLQQNAEEKGVIWKSDLVAIDGGGIEGLLRSVVSHGDSKYAVMATDSRLHAWATKRVDDKPLLMDITEVAKQQQWDQLIPKPVQSTAKPAGSWVGVPLTVTTTNLMWVNADIFDKAGGKIPTTWEAFIDLLAKIKAMGVTPLAHTDTATRFLESPAWEAGQILEAITLGLDHQLYHQAFIERNKQVLAGAGMIKAFDRLAQLRPYLDHGYDYRDSYQATKAVYEGKAGLQIAPGWVRRWLIDDGIQPGQDLVCLPFPGTQGSVQFHASHVAMASVGDDKAKANFAAWLMNPDVQTTINAASASVPARSGLSLNNVDSCTQQAVNAVASATESDQLYPLFSFSQEPSTELMQSYYNIILTFLRGEIDSQTAANQLANVIGL